MCACVCVCVCVRTCVCEVVSLNQVMNGNMVIYAPPENGDIALWSNTRVVKCKYHVSQKQNWFNSNSQWYNILLTFVL